MTLHLSYFVPPAPLIAAQTTHLVDDVDLIEIRTSGSPAQLEGLLSGELDVVVTAVDNLFEWTRAGADVRLVGHVEATTPLSIHATEDITHITHLTGRRFAVDALSNGFALVARHALLTAGVEVEWVEVGGVTERLDALLRGDVAATLLGPPFDARARAAGMQELVRIQDSFPSFPGQGLVVRSALLDDPELGRLLAALRTNGLLEVDERGLDLLTAIRSDLGLLPDGPGLHALSHP